LRREAAHAGAERRQMTALTSRFDILLSFQDNRLEVLDFRLGTDYTAIASPVIGFRPQLCVGAKLLK